MFGYVQPYKPNMLVKEYEQYRSVYCSLCKQLRKDYGFFASLILSYDSTLFAVIAVAASQKCPKIKKGRCAFNLMKKCSFCTNADEALQKASAVSVISFYYKLLDDIYDSNFFKKFLSVFLCLFAKRWRNKAKIKYKYYDDVIGDMLKGQRECEKDEKAYVDKSAEPTANMLARLIEDLFDDDKLRVVGNRFGYYLGKWIYLIDAADDIYKDYKNNNFNPFLNSDIIDVKKSPKLEISSYCNSILNQNAAQCIAAFNLFDFKLFYGILNNIICEGLAQMQKKVLFDSLDKEAQNEQSI